MTVKTLEPTQIKELREHLDAAGKLDSQTLEALRALAVQLDGCSVLPLIGAGMSYDCGMPLAGQLGGELLRDYRAESSFAPHAPNLDPDLADVAEAIYLKAGQAAVVKALGLPDRALWPAADEIERHFCSYRVLARLAREWVFEEAISLNYDCGYEAGLSGEGFLLARGVTPGLPWRDHVTLIADPDASYDPATPGSLVVRKIHGCAQHYREEMLASPTSHPENRIVVRRGQLVNWRDDVWARDHLRATAATHVVLLLGFSGQDPVIAGELRALLSDVYTASQPTGNPRVIVIDYEPDTMPLQGLIHEGLGGVPPAAGAVTQVKTKGSTITAGLLVLLAERLAHNLAPYLDEVGFVLTSGVEGRLAALTVSAPAMMRWSYLLQPPQQNHYMSRVNLVDAARQGYAPLLAEPTKTARALHHRSELRNALGHAALETTEEALGDHSFVVAPSRGKAYLPTGLDFDALRGACRAGGELETARDVLDWPKHLDCIVAAYDSPDWRGFDLMTGMQVDVP